MPTRDVAIYSPSAFGLYDQSSGQAVGGIEVQTTILARELAGRGLRVAHIVFPLHGPSVSLPPGLTLVQRGPHAGGRRLVEAWRTWRAFKEADARAYIARGRSPALGLLASFCALHRRRLVFSTAATTDLTLGGGDLSRHLLALYRLGVRRSDAVVVQTNEQVTLTSQAFPSVPRVYRVPSYAPLGPRPGAPEAFLWLGRLVSYKEPLRYLELAQALPDARFWMIVVTTTETPAELAAEVHARADALSNLDLIEPRAHHEALDLMLRAVASVSTSRLEGMPNVFLEAWARGVPTLSLHVDPDRRIAERGLGVAAAGSWERFVEGAGELWSRRHSRAALSERTRRYVVEVHSPQSVTDHWMTILNEIT